MKINTEIEKLVEIRKINTRIYLNSWLWTARAGLNLPHKLNICFIGGAGGNFLSNMIHQLQTNTVESHASLHFHNNTKSNDVLLSHSDADTTVAWKYFSGGLSFNIYLNAVYKFNITDHNHDMLSSETQLEIYEQAAYYTLAFIKTEHELSLNYDDLYYNREKFVADLYDMLDTAQITYTKNNTAVLTMVDQFIKTCIDPVTDFGNIDSVIWLAWCLGIDRLIFGKSKLFDDIADAKIYVATRNHLYKEIAIGFNQVYFFNG